MRDGELRSIKIRKEKEGRKGKERKGGGGVSDKKIDGE